MTLAVSKALLAKNRPITAFANETDRLNFGEFIAAKVRRPALHEALSEALTASLEQFVKEGGGPSGWIDDIDQIRIMITNDRLAPSQIDIVIMPFVTLENDVRDHWRSWRRRGRKILAKSGIKLGRIHILTGDKMSANMYRNSIPLRVPGLAGPPAW